MTLWDITTRHVRKLYVSVKGHLNTGSRDMDGRRDEGKAMAKRERMRKAGDGGEREGR